MRRKVSARILEWILIFMFALVGNIYRKSLYICR